MEGLETAAFQIISASGAAKSSYIEAIKRAELGDIKGAKASLQKAIELKPGHLYATRDLQALS